MKPDDSPLSAEKRRQLAAGPRPIGTEFTHVFPASITSANPHPRKHTFRVVGHELTGDGFGRTWMGERTETIAVEELPAPTEIPLRAFQSAGHWHEWQREYAEQFA